MKFLMFNIILCFAIISCKPTKKMTGSPSENTASKTDTITIANKELDYEIIILEQGFERYLNTQPNKDFYSTTYLENKNVFYVAEYNRRVRDIVRSRDLYPQEINYDRNKRYGKEVNFLLFNYFQFFEYKYNQKLK